MNPEIIGIICMIFLIILMYTRMWIGFVMLFVGFWGIVAISGVHPAFVVLATVPFRTIADYTFAAITLFLMMGAIVYHVRFGEDLYYTASKWLGQLSGGIAMATSVACAILGVVTDSMVAVVTLGKVAVPEMKKYNYADSLATASIVAGASLASLIPPSIGFILYAMLTGASVGALYIGAIIPGIVLTGLIVLTIAIEVRINPSLAMVGPKTSFKEKVVSIKHTWAMGLIFVLILAGIYFGIFTPTEAGAIGAFGAIVIAWIARRLTKKNLLNAILETAQMTAMVTLLISGAYIFIKLMVLSKLPFTLADFIVSLNFSKYVVLIFIVFVYLLLGMFTDIMACILITVPILSPLVVAMGFNPVWFGIFVVIIAEIGFITPPIGMNVFMLSGISGVPLVSIFKGVWPFVLILIIFLVILTIFPEIVTFLPSTMSIK